MSKVEVTNENVAEIAQQYIDELNFMHFELRLVRGGNLHYKLEQEYQDISHYRLLKYISEQVPWFDALRGRIAIGRMDVSRLSWLPRSLIKCVILVLELQIKKV